MARLQNLGQLTTIVVEELNRLISPNETITKYYHLRFRDFTPGACYTKQRQTREHPVKLHHEEAALNVIPLGF